MPFSELDTNHDGLLSKDEVGVAAPPREPRGPAVRRSSSGRSVQMVLPPTADHGLSPLAPLPRGSGGLPPSQCAGTSPPLRLGMGSYGGGDDAYGAGTSYVGTRRERAVAAANSPGKHGRFAPPERTGSRFIHSDAARAATVEAHIAADAADLAAAAARDSASRAADAQRRAMAEQMAAFQNT